MTVPVEVVRGTSPLLLAQPHGSTWLPADVAGALNDTGRALADTDWHIDRLYDGLATGATIVRAHFSRYVIDANRDPGGGSLYPGQNTTGLCPTTDFDGKPIYLEGREPDAADVTDRLAAFHVPYHQALTVEIDRLRRLHGGVILHDCHSIRSVIPHLFQGTLPVLNIGTDGGRSCAPAVEQCVWQQATTADSRVLNGRFRGGWTTRHHGRPADGVHAVQLEIAQRAYMDESPPWTYRSDRADRLRAILGHLLLALEALAPTLFDPSGRDRHG